MGKLIYSAIASLDGYIADEDGRFDWAEPDEEVHAFINALQRRLGTYLYGRRMYEVMAAWETVPTEAEREAHLHEFAQVWRAADKVVFSTTLESVSTARTRLERDFDPDAVAQMTASAERDVSIAGPHLAAAAVSAGLVDEYQLFVAPTIVGGGTRLFPDHVRVPLKLREDRRFGNGMMYLRYTTAR